MACGAPAAGGVTDQDGVGQVRRFHQFGQILDVGVNVVAVPRLAQSTVTSAVVRNAAVTLVGGEEQLVFEDVGVQRVGVVEDDRLAAAPALERACLTFEMACGTVDLTVFPA
jgi:hypothetical protein